MKTYDVTITETTVHTVQVEATTEHEAREIAEEMHCQGHSRYSHTEERDVFVRESNNPSR